MSLSTSIIAGHSHVFAFGYPSTPYNDSPGLVELPLGREGIFGFRTKGGPYDPSYWDSLIEISSGKTIFIFWLGSQHLAEFLFESPRPFDFFVKTLPAAPTRTDVEIIPEAVIREYQSAFLSSLGPTLKRLKEIPDCKVFLCGTPPPKGNNDELRELMLSEPYFQTRAKIAGIDISQTPLTDRYTLLKFWHVIQEFLQDAANTCHVPFLPVPRETQDSEGFLLRQYWNNDVGHANYDYGKILFNIMSTHID